MMRWLVAYLICLAACEPTSANDWAKGRKEMELITSENAKWGEHERAVQERKRAYARQFAGKVQPGVGCGVCPDMCKSIDLRQVPVATFQRMYRHAAMQSGYPASERMYHLAWYELLRLGCIAEDGGPTMQNALLELADASEDPAVRYSAALHALVQGFAVERALEVMGELAAGSGKFVDHAKIQLMEYEAGITPTF